MAVRERLVAAAFDLFEERGFEQTTVDDIAARAGVGRTTFFRHFRAKEDAVLADHDRLVPQVQALLGDTQASRELGDRVVTAARAVLQHYLDEGEQARRRYRLSGTVPAIRAREAASQRSYQRAFLAAIHQGMGGGPEPTLEAELAATAVITATHHVLRRWLQGRTDTPETDFQVAIERALTPWLPLTDGGSASPDVARLARRATPLLEELLDHLREVAAD